MQHISQMQLDDAVLARLGQKPDTRPSSDVAPDFVFYTGCNVLKTPHIALLALDIMDTLGITYKVLGGPSHCCGVVQMRTGDVATSGRFGEATMDKLAASKTKEVLAWCPSCHTQFNDTTLPTVEKTARREAVRDDAVHAVPAPLSRPAAAAPDAARRDAGGAAQASRAFRASCRPPKTCSTRCRGSSWST